MFKNNLFTRAVSLTVMGAFAATLAPQKAQGQMLVPISFSQMYYLAQNGQVEALRGSVRRGMNIDVMNQNGDTGLCIAARRRDTYTYNAFRAAGANPRHPCTQTIYGYEDFVNSAGTAPISGTSRAAYGMMGKEEYKVAPWVWWTAGAALVGGGIALALSGGGGGGKKGSSTPVKEKIDSAGKYLAQNASVMYTAGSGEKKENSSNLSMSNSKESIKTLDFNEDVTNNSKDLNVILKATNGGTYQNNKNTDLNASSGVVAMSAYDGSSAANSGALNVSGNNAAIGMLAGDHSSAYNNGTEANGIHLTFKGYDKTNSIIGMYGDAGSSIVNNGLIDGTASLTSEESGTTSATKGSMTGMELMIINANTDSSSTVSKATNSDTIDLVAGQHSSITDVESVEVNLIGMGSYLDNGFLNGSKNINRGEKAEITNDGNINLSYFGKYASEKDYIQNGTGGIVGIKSDANTVAVNNGKININMSTTDSGSQSVAAGMQSVHGGAITNSSTGEINITSGATDSRVTYGMVAVKGNGTVSGLGNISPVVTNNGTITLAISNAYGMAAYLGGTLKNNNTIILGAEGDTDYTNNVGMYGIGEIRTDMTNVGNIHIYSNNSTGIKNDYSGATTITNTGTITIEKNATGSHPFAGKYSNIINNGTVDYKTTPNTNPSSGSGSSSGSSSSSQSASAFPDTLAFTLQDAVINTDGNNTLTSASGGTSASTTYKVINNGIVSLTGSSYTAAIANNSALGEVRNNNTINLNDRDDGTTVQSVGIYATSATLNGSSTVNNGTININTKKSAGMISASTADSVAIINTENGKIVVNNEESVGMFTAKGSTADIKNYGVIEVKKKNSYAIISNGSGKIYNYNTILLSDDEAVAFYIGKDSTSEIAEYGTVEVTEGKKDTIGMRIDKDMTLTELLDVGDDIPEDFIYYEIGGNVIMDFSGGTTTTGTSTFARTVNGGTLTINSDFATGKDGQVLFKGLSGSTTINNANLGIQHKDAIGISITGSSANATNAKNINVSGENASGMYAANGATITNGSDGESSTGVIEVKNASASGMHAVGSAKAENAGTILASTGATAGQNGSVGILAENGASVNNTGTISATGVGTTVNNGASGIYTNNGASVTNTGTINASGYKTIGINADQTQAGTTNITNAEGGVINSTQTESAGIYANSSGEGNKVNITNNGTMNASGANNDEQDGSRAIHAIGQGAKAVNDTNGIINVGASGSDKCRSAGIVIEDGAKAENSAIINIYDIDSYGIISSTNGVSTVAENLATGEINASAKGAYGMISNTNQNSSVRNLGTIRVIGEEARGLGAKDGGTATNTSGTIIVSGSDSFGIYAQGSGSTATNSASIKLTGSNTFGMRSFNGGDVVNEGKIDIAPESSSSGTSETNIFGMHADTDVIQETGQETETKSAPATATNKGTINVGFSASYGMAADEGNTVTNGDGNGTGIINVSASSSTGMYGFAASNTINKGTINILKDATNSYGITADDATATNETGAEINVSAEGAYGMYAQNGSGVVNKGTINILEDATDSIGMFATGADATATNETGAEINVSASDSYGMYAQNGSGVVNKGTIKVDSAGSYGMFATGSGSSAINASGATIIVNASDSYGMYAVNGGKITNNGTIIINDASSYGMLASGSGSTATNTNNSATHIYMPTEASLSNGLVGKNGATATGKAAEVKPTTLSLGAPKTTMMASNSGKIINNGVITTNSALDFSASTDDTSSVNIANGGSFKALSFTGNVVADSDITLGGFENEYTNKNSFVGEDMGLNIISGSYLFNADKALNDNGNTDVIMSKKDFASVVENSSLADFLENNYAEKNNENLFNSLKSAENSAQFNQNLNDLFGNNLMSNLTFEDLNTLREMNFAMNDNLTEQKKGTFSLADGVEIVKGQKFGSSSHYALNGYSDGKTSVAVGLAVADVRADNKSKYSNKLDKNIMLSMPVSHKTHGFELITSPKLGYARGSYEREGLSGENYDGTVERKTFALMNEARYPFKFNGVKIVPNAEFNMIGFNVKGREDTKQYSLNIDSQNHYSVESGVGFNLEKEFMPNKDSVLKISGGMSFYKEFADPYDLKVGMNEMNGNYKLKDEKHGDKRTVLRFGAGYNIKENLDISAILRTNIDREYRTDTGLSLNYHF